MGEPHYPEDYPEPTGSDPNTPPADLPYSDRTQATSTVEGSSVSHSSCPHCGTVFVTGFAGHVTEGDCGVCAVCLNLLIATPTGWRFAWFEECVLWDLDPRVRAMRGMQSTGLPE